MLSLLYFLSILVTVSRGEETSVEPPSIARHPPNDEILFHVPSDLNSDIWPVTLECEAEGNPLPKYFWLKNGTKFNWQNYDIRITQRPGSGTLVITKPEPDDVGIYQCYAENMYGKTHSNIFNLRQIIFTPAELLHDTPTTIAVKLNEPLKLECTEKPTGYPEPELFWVLQKYDTMFSSIIESRMAIDPNGNLWFSHVTEEDIGNITFTCGASEITKKVYSFGSQYKLLLSENPVNNILEGDIVTQYISESQKIAIRGDDVKIYCIFGGKALKKISWFKDNIPIEFNGRIIANMFGKVLSIKNITFEDEGNYKCLATDEENDLTHLVQLQVESKPYFITLPNKQIVEEGENIELNCEAGGNPQPKIEWTFNGKTNENNSIFREENNKILIENVGKMHIGNYACNASNSHGYIYKDVSISVKLKIQD